MPEERDSRTGAEGRGVKGIGSQVGRQLGGAATPPPSAGAAGEEERQTLEEQASRLSDRLSDLRRRASLADLRDRIEDLSGLLANFPAVLEKARQNGYLYKSYLENKIRVLQEQWRGLGQRIDREAAQQGRVLTREADGLQQRLSAMGTRLRADALNALDRDVSALESKVEDTFRDFYGFFDNVETNARQTEQQLRAITWTMEQVAEASFRLRVDENVIEAVEAQYLTDGDEGPKGVFFLTDQRVLFEQKEDVATKKFLFITTEKERVQKLLLEAPVGAVERAKPGERRKFLSKQELLELTLGPQAPVTLALFRLKGDSEPWQGLIGRVLSGDIDRERVGAAAGEEAPAEKAPPAAAGEPAAGPTACPTCGANITTEIVRGMQSIQCEYCGTVIRL